MSFTEYRPGDVPTAIGPFRLTVGGLAEIAARLNAQNVGALAEQVRAITPNTARHLAVALSRPCGNAASIERLPDAQIALLMPAAARCITTALGGPT